jgi:hypothetical protein
MVHNSVKGGFSVAGHSLHLSSVKGEGRLRGLVRTVGALPHLTGQQNDEHAQQDGEETDEV